MAVSTTNNSVFYTGDGASTSFAVTFAFFVATDLLVYVTDTSGNTITKVLNTDYTVTGGSDNTGTIVFGSAPASGYTIQIVRSVPYTQDDVFIDNDILDASVWMQALDRLTMLAQQNKFNGSRSITQPAADTTSLAALPTAGNRAGKYLAFDASGNPIATVEVGSWKGTWATGTSYNIGDVIVDGAGGNDTLDVYTALVAHTAGTWSTDLAANKWAKVLDYVVLAANAGSVATASLYGTSTTSLTIGTGSTALTTQASKSFNVGVPVFIVDSADNTKWMGGLVTAYNSTTGALTVNVTATGGSGTIATWNVYVSGYTQSPATAANPTATISGGAAQNGSATTFMRSDAAPALALTETTAALASAVTLTTGSTWYNGPSLTLSAGVWLVIGTAAFFYTTVHDFACRIVDNTPTQYGGSGVTTGVASHNVCATAIAIVTNPVGNVVYLQGTDLQGGGSMLAAVGGFPAGTNGTYILAIRIG